MWHSTLKSVFGHTTLKPGQAQIIEAILGGRDVLGVLPTGYGKSLCFQLPTVILGGMTLVVSPLLALMHDQVDSLRKKGLSATALTSEHATQDRTRVLEEVRTNKLQFLYCSPEQLPNPAVHKAITRAPPQLVVIDEAHCIEDWGHDFRPAYLKIQTTLATLSPRPIWTAFTATATTETESHIISSLVLHNPVRVRHSPLKQNLRLQVHHCQTQLEKELLLLRIVLNQRPARGIVYCGTRHTVERIGWMLKQWGVRVRSFHGALDAEEKKGALDEFLSGAVRVMVATTAFGMGVDAPDIRWILHIQLPLSIEQYVQEIGRAGRDGASATAILLTHQSDIRIVTGLLKRSAHVKKQRKRFTQLQQLLTLESCLWHGIATYFSYQEAQMCARCSKCAEQVVTHPLLQYVSVPEYRVLQRWASDTQIKREALPDTLLCYIALAWTASRTNPALKNRIPELIPGIGQGRRAFVQHMIKYADATKD